MKGKLSMICSGRPCRIRITEQGSNSGRCSLETASFEDMDAEAVNCGFVRVNNRFLLLKYNVDYKRFVCDYCSYYNGTTCSESGDKRYRNAHACKAFNRSLKDIDMFKVLDDCVGKV